MDNNFLNHIPAYTMPGIFFVQSLDGKVLAWNELFARSVVPQNSNAFTLIHALDSVKLQDALEEVILMEHDVRIEVRLNYLTPQNAAWYLFTISLIEINSIRCFQFVGFDITEKIYQNIINEFALCVTESDNNKKIIEELLKSAELLTGSAYSFCYYFEAPRKASLILSEQTKKFAQELKEPLYSWSINDFGIFSSVASTTNANQLSDITLLSTSFQYCFLLPIKNGSSFIGYICLGNKNSHYNEDDKAYCELLIDYLLDFFQQQYNKEQCAHFTAIFEQSIKNATLSRLTTALGGKVTYLFDSLQTLIQQIFAQKELADSFLPILNNTFDATQDIVAFREDLLSLINVKAENIQIIDVYDTLELMIPFLEEDFGCVINLEAELYGTSPFIAINPLHLKYIIHLLCKNAIAAMLYSNVITIRISYSNLSHLKYCINSKHMLSIAVCDRGHGIASHDMSHIFEPFFTNSFDAGQRGLGLTIAKNLIHLYYGEITCSSEEGLGTTVTIQLPCQYQKKGVEGKRGVDMLVLIVMSDVAMLSMISLLLEEHDYALLVANSVQEAVELVESYGNTIDLLITETSLSECNGCELASFLSVNQPNMKVVYLASSLSHHHSIPVIKDDGVKFLPRPFSGKELLDVIAHLCNS